MLRLICLPSSYLPADQAPLWLLFSWRWSMYTPAKHGETLPLQCHIHINNWLILPLVSGEVTPCSSCSVLWSTHRDVAVSPNHFSINVIFDGDTPSLFNPPCDFILRDIRTHAIIKAATCHKVIPSLNTKASPPKKAWQFSVYKKEKKILSLQNSS